MIRPDTIYARSCDVPLLLPEIAGTFACKKQFLPQCTLSEKQILHRKCQGYQNRGHKNSNSYQRKIKHEGCYSFVGFYVILSREDYAQAKYLQNHRLLD